MSNLYKELFKMKGILRKGWCNRKLSNEDGRVESDAEHTFSMAMLAIEIMEKEKLELDQLKVLKMVLFHELCEIDFGDHTPHDKITKEEKYEGELKCVERIAKECDMPEILDLWKEFEAAETPEAKFVKKMDKLDAIMQSKIYSHINQDGDETFNEFYNFDYGVDLVGEFDKYIKELCEELK